MARSRVSAWNAALTARRAAIGRRGACEKPPPPRLQEPTVACVAGHCLLAREWLAPSFD